MDCITRGSAATLERRECTAQGYRRFRYRDCGRQFNERSGDVLNRTSLPSDVIAIVVFCRLRYRLILRDLSEVLALGGIKVSHEAIRDQKVSLLLVVGDVLCRRRGSVANAGGWRVQPGEA